MKKFYEVLGALVVAFVVAFTAFVVTNNNDLLGSGQSVDQAQVVSETSVTVGPTPVTLASANNFCASRIVGVAGTAIRISFNNTASSTYGHVLAASSTTPLPVSQFGCGAITAYAVASTTVTLTTTTVY